jgi:hypothetical protein
MIEAVIPVYQQHLTHADIRGIIDFHNSEPGQKYLKEMPVLMSESDGGDAADHQEAPSADAGCGGQADTGDAQGHATGEGRGGFQVARQG